MMRARFPLVRKRRMRRTDALRRMVRETRVSVDNLVAPLFVVPGRGVRREIRSMPEQYHLSVDMVAGECTELWSLGIPAVLLFGVPETKDTRATEAFREDGLVQEAVRAIKRATPDMTVITDVCLCEYLSHGHCGVVKGERVDNDATLPLLARMALSHVDAGADVVAPSDMMDGRVGAIREALDGEGFSDIAILSYAAKFCSSFYGPFREAAHSAPQFGDRRSYQMDPCNGREAVHEVLLDEAEGADVLMVKPALAYLDILRTVRERTLLPLAAYNVSGEYSMVFSAARQGVIELECVMMEMLTAIRRAGADCILTYFARRAAKLLKETGR